MVNQENASGRADVKVILPGGKELKFTSVPPGSFRMGWPESPELVFGSPLASACLFGGIGALLTLLAVFLAQSLRARRVQFSLAGMVAFSALLGLTLFGWYAKQAENRVIAKSMFLFRRYQKFENEMPAHGVTISRPFQMGIYEVTQEQFESVMGNGHEAQIGSEKLPPGVQKLIPCRRLK